VATRADPVRPADHLDVTWRAGQATARWRPLNPAHAWLVLAGAWLRAAAQYRTSLAMLTMAQIGASGLDFAAILLIFSRTSMLGGFSLTEVMFLYGTSAASFGISDCLFSSVENLAERIRTGVFDTMLVRPVPVLVQVFADEFTPKRFGKLATAGAVLGIALARLNIAWTPARVLAVPVMIVSGTVIFGALWVLQGAFQFVATDAREAANTFTYGGQELTAYPLALYGGGVVRAVTFVVPLAFINWQPALFVLDRPDPTGLPHLLRYASPAVAVAATAVAALAWRAALRRYRSTGS
jgi:ABC-2 type transport system permease protein